MATQTNNWLKSVFQTAAFYGAFFIFAAVGALAGVLCAVPALLLHGPRARAFGQRLIQSLFHYFIRFLRVCGLIELDAGDMVALQEEAGLIVAANHPGLLDAVLMVSRMPQAVCLMKGSLARNIIFSETARLAGYIHNRSSLGLIKKCEARLREGASLLVFPEGTRTVEENLLPFKMGFALVAVLTRSPVQIVFITCESNCLGKGRPLFEKPAFPIRYSLRLGRRFQPSPGEDAKHFGRTIENYFLENFSRSKQGQPVEINPNDPEPHSSGRHS